MKKKIITLFTCCVLACSMLIGCGSKFANETKDMNCEQTLEYMSDNMENFESKKEFMDAMKVIGDKAKKEGNTEVANEVTAMKAMAEAIPDDVFMEQLIKYINKSKEASDLQLCDTLRTAISVALTDPDYISSSSYKTIAPGDYSISNFTNESDALGQLVVEIIGTNDPVALLQSKDAKASGTIKVHIGETSQITVYVPDTEIMAGPSF